MVLAGARVLSHEGGKHLDDLRVICYRVAGYALQGVDPAQANIELGTAELLDGSGEALGDLPGPVKTVGKSAKDCPDSGHSASEDGQERCAGPADLLSTVLPG